MNYEVASKNTKKPNTVSMADIEVGQVGYIYSSPIPSYIGEPVICIQVYGKGRRIFALNRPTGGGWDGTESGNIVRLLEPGEEIIIRGK